MIRIKKYNQVVEIFLVFFILEKIVHPDVYGTVESWKDEVF